MTNACVNTSGTSTTNGASVLFFGFHCSFTILEPSEKGWPLFGIPALYASIMVGLATITLEHFVGPGGRDHRPVLVSLEIRERDSAWRSQRVFVLRVNGRSTHDDKPCRGYRNREFAFALHG